MSHLINDQMVAKAEVLRKKGNVNAENKIFGSALNFYNESLCQASQGKESLALTYAERSAVCFECDEFESCLRNIQLALDHKYPSNKIAVLNERKFECLKLMESNKKRGNHWEFLKLTYPANDKIPFIVDCLELNTNEKYGRHIITNKDLKVGDIVAIEKPYSAHLDGNYYGYCSTCCSRKPFDFIPCITRTNGNICLPLICFYFNINYISFQKFFAQKLVRNWQKKHFIVLNPRY